MKIKSLHIDGFGALVNYSLNFNDELNSYFLNNGEGKTTIICFIKSMLFGLDKSNKKNHAVCRADRDCHVCRLGYSGCCTGHMALSAE